MTVEHPMSATDTVRRINARWVLTGELVLVTACHLGGEATGLTDMVLLRDAREALPLLPGTTLAGALRGHLTDVLEGFRADEPPAVAELFGGERGDDEGSQSPLVVFDSFGQLPRGRLVELRDGVALDARSGTVEDNKKYDLELLAPGTVFPLRLELAIPDRQREDVLLSQLIAALDGLASGHVSLGARRSRGLGAVTTRAWKARRFDGSTARGWIDWLTTDALVPMDTKAQTAATPRDAVALALKRAGVKSALTAPADRRALTTVEVTLSFPGALLVRSPAPTADAPDVTQLASGGRPVLPGTSVAGALRTQASRILHSIAAREGVVGERADACVDTLVSRVFGPRLAGDRDSRPEPRASKLRVSECTLSARRARVTRIRVDRFTQAVASGALFDEEPVVGAQARLTVELREPEEWQHGLLLLLLKDLLAGGIPLGGTVAVGRGVCSGRAELHASGWPRAVTLTPEEAPPGDDRARVDAAIRAVGDEIRARREGGVG